MCIRKVAYFIGWRLVDRLTPGQRSRIQKMLTPRHRYAIEELLTSADESGSETGAFSDRAGRKLARNLSVRLWSLGFAERAITDLCGLVDDHSKPIQFRKKAACELCMWFANQCNKDGAARCLALLPKALEGEKNALCLRAAAVLAVESLEIMGNREAARLALHLAIELGPDADLFLAAANLESALPDKLAWINKALALHRLSPVSLDASPELPPLYRLRSAVDSRKDACVGRNAPKVTVIMPAYNAEESIGTALDSVLAQTWTNLEILVVDDCSGDGTVAIVEKCVERDSRVRLIRSESNGGTYVARNLGLRAATGDFVTCHNADDWANPERVEKQVSHLMKNRSVIGNTSQFAHLTPELEFLRKGSSGLYVEPNIASLMFRRHHVVDSVGYWDSVRSGSGGEFIERVKRFFGDKAIRHLTTGPLTFAGQPDLYLTGHRAFGCSGEAAEMFREYRESYTHFHANTSDLRLEFPLKTRPFPVPEPMRPQREVKVSERRHLDVILASDHRLVGGFAFSNAEEITVQRGMGLRTGLVQMRRYDIGRERTINPLIAELVDGDRVQIVVYGEKISCDLLILRYPPILQDRQLYVPDVRAEQVVVIMNQTPYREYEPKDSLAYDIKHCAEQLHEYFGHVGTWYPIGPLIREVLHTYHAEEVAAIRLADEDWVNIIDVDQWRRTSRPPRGPRVRIGKHSRNDYRKWPDDRDELLAVYPDSDDCEVHLLGGAKAPMKLLGGLPSNWHVLEFGAMDPKDFLATLDVFVYYTHRSCFEAFGRVIIEAMAAGVPAILPYCYQQLFGEAAIYAEPAEVKQAINRLMNDDEYYQSQVERAWRYVETNFGHSTHASRLKAILGRKNLER